MKKIINFLSSAKLAILLGFLFMSFSFAGAVLPQEGVMEPREITEWQAEHPLVTSLLSQTGLFHAFRSWPFLAVLLALGINTLVCTITRLLGGEETRRYSTLEYLGSVIFHVSLIMLFAGGFWSAAARFDGYVVLTEGQMFREVAPSYLRYAEGPLRRREHTGFLAQLKSVYLKYESGKHLVNLVSTFEVEEASGRAREHKVKVNHPWKHKGLAFTQDKTGFSPCLSIHDTATGKLLFDSFVALKTFQHGSTKEHKDFISLPVHGERLQMTLYPSFSREGGKIHNAGDELTKPLLRLERMDESGNVTASKDIESNETAVLGDLSVQFADLRYWASFRIVDDPGYPLVVVAMWLGFAALLARYAQGMISWLKE